VHSPSHPLRRSFAVALCGALLALAGCSSTSSRAGTPDPSLEDEAARRKAEFAAAEEARNSLPQLMLDLDKTLERYFLATFNSGSPRAEDTRTRLRNFLEQKLREPIAEDRTQFDTLLLAARDASTPRYQGIALAALGFSTAENAMRALEPLLNGLDSTHDDVVNSAVLGLAMLQDHRTPPGKLARVMNDEERRVEDRATAAWALHQVQEKAVDPAPFEAVWTDLLAGPLDEDPSQVVVSAVRGLGLSRNPEHCDTVVRYLEHPAPLVRLQATIALGRLGNLAAVEPLLALIGGAETNESVRLGASKALRALAGYRGEGYDVEEWRRIFDLGGGASDR
jgi:hypothetical protein